MTKFTFNARVFVCFDIEAETEEEAIEILMRADLKRANIGTFADGSPVIATIDDIEDSSGGEWSAALIDGKER